MKKTSRLLLALILSLYPLFNSSCFGKNIEKTDENSNFKKSTSKSSKNKFKQIEYTTQKLANNKTKVNIVMYIPSTKKQKDKIKKAEISNLQGKKISNLRKKVSKVTIDEKSYMKIEFTYIVEIRDITNKDFVWPVPGYNTITSGFNDSQDRKHVHGAIDIAGAGIYGAKVVASNQGRVLVANTDGWGGGYGQYVVIDHGSGRTTLYGHMSKVTVKVGKKVSTGQQIGNVGSTGSANGPHLHFEYRVDGVRTDPADILDI